jgi:predicted transcriptional regulator
MVIFALRKHAFYAPNFTSVIDERYRKNLESVSNLENGHKRRDRLYIIAEILNIAKDDCLKTQIMYRANLSFTQLNEYLSFLTKMDLIEAQNENKKTIYRTTAKGDKFLEKYDDIADLLGNSEENR